MKIEVGSFTPASSSSTILLDDENLQIKGMIFHVTKNGSNVNLSEGFTDGTNNRAASTLDDTVKDSARTSTYCIYHKANVSSTATVKLAGKVPTNGLATAGEFQISWDNYDAAYTVHFMAIGE